VYFSLYIFFSFIENLFVVNYCTRLKYTPQSWEDEPGNKCREVYLIYQLFNASVMCVLMISINSLFGVFIIYFMFYGIRCQCWGEIILNILVMQSTTKDDITSITIGVIVIEEKQGKSNTNNWRRDLIHMMVDCQIWITKMFPFLDQPPWCVGHVQPTSMMAPNARRKIRIVTIEFPPHYYKGDKDKSLEMKGH